MEGSNKEVYFDQYCQTCKNEDVSESDPEGPCWDCLEQPVNQDSHKPVCWVEKSPVGKSAK